MKIKLQRSVIDNLKEEYPTKSAASGEESTASQKLQKQYTNASKALDRMNKELDGYKDDLYDRLSARQAEGKTAKEAKKMGGELKDAEKDTKSFKV